MERSRKALGRDCTSAFFSLASATNLAVYSPEGNAPEADGSYGKPIGTVGWEDGQARVRLSKLYCRCRCLATLSLLGYRCLLTRKKPSGIWCWARPVHVKPPGLPPPPPPPSPPPSSIVTIRVSRAAAGVRRSTDRRRSAGAKLVPTRGMACRSIG